MKKERAEWFKKYFSRKEGKRDPKYREFFLESYNKLLQKAYRLLDLEEFDVNEKQTIVLYRPLAMDSKTKVAYRVATDVEDDTKLEFDQVQFTILLFGQSKLYYYQSSVDLAYDFSTDDVYGEFRHSDITNIEFGFYYDNLENPRFESLGADIFVSGALTLELVLRNRLYTGKTTDFEISLNDIEKRVVKQLRSLVR